MEKLYPRSVTRSGLFSKFGADIQSAQIDSNHPVRDAAATPMDS
jgi:hypothetical protein